MYPNEIKNNRLSVASGKPKSIIIAPLYNFILKNTEFKPDWLRSNYKYDYSEIESYFLIQHKMPYVPWHYFCAFKDDDYVIILGRPQVTKSNFLETLCDCNVISTLHRESILIVLQEDYRLEPVDRRMLQILSNNLLSSLMTMYTLTKENIFFLDDILVDQAVERMDSKKLKYNQRFMLQPAKYYDHNQLYFQLRNYLKK